MGRFEQARSNIRRAYEAGRETVKARRAERARREAEEEEPHPEPPNTPEPVVAHATTSSRDDLEVPSGLRVAAAWGWRLLVLGVIVYFVIKIVLAPVTFGVAVSIEDSVGNVETADNATQITLSTNVCSNALLRTVTVSGGVAQFPNLRFYTSGSSRQLIAQASIGLGVSSTTFTVQANPDLIFADAFASCTP